MKHFVGLFNEEQLKSGYDKERIEEEMRKTNLKYILNKVKKKKGVMYMEVHLTDDFNLVTI